MTEAPPPATADKAVWRRWAARRRAVLDFTALSETVAEHLASSGLLSGTVLTFAAMADEIDLSDLRQRVTARWALTRTPPAGPLSIHLASDRLERHSVGFLQPPPEAPQLAASDVDVVLVPGLAFDRTGGRLGRGMGYYDRLIDDLPPQAITVGIVPDALVVPRLPMTSRDRRVGFLATESGVVRCEAGPGASGNVSSPGPGGGSSDG